MRYGIIIVAVITAFASSASASLTITGGAGLTNLPIAGNDFTGNLSGFVDQLYNGGADITATAAGTLQFYLHASESGFNNQLVQGTWNAGGTNFLSGTVIGSENENAWSNSGIAIGSPISILAGQTFSSLGIGFYASGDPASSLDARAGTAGFGVFRVSSQGNSGYTQLFIGYDDNGAGPDDNHDDMIVSVVFTRDPGNIGDPVPEASTIAVWSALSLVGGVVVYKKRKAAAV
jgi:hypothetical protein